MFIKPAALVALLSAVAAHAAPEPAPYMPHNARTAKLMSVRDMFGVAARADDGYTPSQSLCGLGQTCAEACGAGFQTCASDDDAIHCFNPAAQQVCCPDGTGNSCDPGYYCTGTTTGDTVCCPNGQSLAQCAAAYSVSGRLTAETAAPTTSSTSSSSSTSTTAPPTTTHANTTTTSTTATSASGHPHKHGNGTLTLIGTSYTTTSCSTTGAGAATLPAQPTNNLTATAGGPSPSASQVSTSAASATRFVQPVGAAAALLAAAFAVVL
ncbi:hypothetical protein SPI_08706 [Niveomyces insectorum RCEF 264]|uniref:Prp 4 CRoW domain-containing protein n=1 Tax=Niveomyces insectorum RCEF 264 TaxID=1081102 RepID=A0A162IBN6_9HYPO|nr:hypothetical protein SPI_08706 [Niveomyces insectorum RCEF 264]